MEVEKMKYSDIKNGILSYQDYIENNPDFADAYDVLVDANHLEHDYHFISYCLQYLRDNELLPELLKREGSTYGMRPTAAVLDVLNHYDFYDDTGFRGMVQEHVDEVVAIIQEIADAVDYIGFNCEFYNGMNNTDNYAFLAVQVGEIENQICTDLTPSQCDAIVKRLGDDPETRDVYCQVGGDGCIYAYYDYSYSQILFVFDPDGIREFLTELFKEEA
jgi:hypothetical protein